MEDSFYIKKIKNGETKYFEFIVKKYQTHIFNIVRKITGSYTASEDITQEAFLKFFNSMDSFDENNPVFPYLLRIAVNCAKDYIKKEKKQAEIKKEISARKIGPYETADKLEEIYELIYKLPENQRKALLLHYRDGKSVKEIATVMGISVSNAKVLLFRGRKALFVLWKKKN
jgi:RNA polymerase sigma-70 factor (ECF subfamily)